MEKVLLRNIRIPDPDTQRVETADLLFVPTARGEKGRILEISRRITAEDAHVIEGEGDCLLPCFVDLASDFCEPGYEGRECIETGSLSAFFGGYSDVLLTPDTKPFADNISTLSHISSIIDKKAHCNVHMSAGITLGGKGKELCDLDALWAQGVKLFSDGSEQRIDHKILREAMKKGYPIMLTPGRDPLYADSVMTEGRAASLLGIESEPASAEERAVASYLVLAAETGCPIHIRSISSGGSVEMIKYAKSKGVKVSCSTSPWYFSLTDDDTVFIGANSKVYPPLRSVLHREAVIKGLAEGTIDCIDSGHSPKTQREKSHGMKDSAFGAIGLQSVFACAMTYLVEPGHIDIFRLMELMCINPARILGISVSHKVDINCRAFNLSTPSEEFILTNSYLKSRSVNCPYVGMSLCGRIKNTFIL